MRRSRVYTEQPLVPDDTAEMSRGASHYLGRVLRLSVGDPVTLFNGDGRDYRAEICEFRRDSVFVRVIESQALDNESPLNITLVQAISRGDRMDYSLQKATELGVNCIQPVTSQRVEVRLDEKKQVKRLAHWRSVVVSACEQSGRAGLPEVRPSLALDQWLRNKGQAQCLVLDLASTLKLSSVTPGVSSVSILVGPEGGFTDAEMEQVRASGVTAVSLGPRVLRTETAGSAAIAVLQAVAGDF